MKTFILGFLGLLCVSNTAWARNDSSVSIPMAAEDWKGAADPNQFSFGGMGGLGLIDGAAGFEALGTIATKVIPRGFVPDINNSVWVELDAGPWFGNLGTGLVFSGQLRWDFLKDNQWTLYASGGIGSDVLFYSGTSRFEIYPRLALGGMLRLTPFVSLRGEFSHDFIGVGVNLTI